MRIVCPNCDAAYDVPDAMLRAGGAVRCARCGQDWAPVPAPVPPEIPGPEPLPVAAAKVPEQAPAPAREPVRVAVREPIPEPAAGPALGLLPEPSADPRGAKPLLAESPASMPVGRAPVSAARPVPRAGGPVLAGWVLSAAVLLGLAWGAYAWRSEIMQAWPPSARVYAALGLAGR